jgi:hypothetical protein
MARITNKTRSVTEKRLELTPKQEEVLDSLAAIFYKMHENGMGAREIAIMLLDLGPSVPSEVYQWQPFAFAALYFDNQLFSAFMNGDARAREEATLPLPKPLEHFKREK